MWSFVEFLTAIFVVYSAPNHQVRTIKHAITTPALLNAIRGTSKWCKKEQKFETKIFKNVFGPAVEMDGVYIGEIVIEFNHLSVIDVYKYHDGRRYLHIQISHENGKKTAQILWVHAIPNGLSGAQLMVFSNALFFGLRVHTAHLIDASYITYTGCHGVEQHLRLIDLYALRGNTHGWFFQFGYDLNPQIIASEMTAIFHSILPPKNYTFSGMKMQIDKRTELVPLMNYYWNRNKCIFSKMYNGLIGSGFFNRLHWLNGPLFQKTKVFVYSKQNNMLI